MADNILVSQGVGTTIATDDIGGVQYQRVKLSQGSDGSATDVSSAAPLQVTLANTGANSTAVKVDGSAVTQPVSGTVTASAQPGVDIGDVTINNASGASAVNIQDGGNSITVDGTVAATQSGTWNVTNISGTVSLPTGAATAANQSTEITALQLIDDAIVTDNGAFTDGTTKLNMSGFVFDETAGTALTENDAAAARVDSKRAQIAVIEDPTTRGRYATVTASNAVKVDGSAVTQPVSDTGATSGGLSKYHLVSAASTNAANIKSSAGQIYAITAFNTNASARYIKFHNTSGTPTAGSGVTDSFLIPGNSSGLVINFDKGIAFSTGIGITLTTGMGDSDTGAVAATEILVNVYYK